MKNNDLIEAVISFVQASWPSLDNVFKNDHTGELKSSWLQASWELLVEGSLRKT